MNPPIQKPPVGAVLLLALGGPNRSEEIRPFLKRIMQGRPSTDEQLEEIAYHYEAIGGKSPMNELTLEQGKALEQFIQNQNLSIPVYVGFRHAAPYLTETLERMISDGIQRARALILAPHRSEASWDSYHRAFKEASEEIGKTPPKIDFVQPFFDHPLFIDAVTDRVKGALDTIPHDRSPILLFTAHSLPVHMAKQSHYVEQVTTTARLVMEKLNRYRWEVVYQSRSGDPKTPWLLPDICDALRALAQEGECCAMVVPIGFLCDHVEILYDLDIKARGVADEHGIQFIRAKTVGCHPRFIQMMAELFLGRIFSLHNHAMI